MNSQQEQPIIIIFGPTATGKSAFALELARRIDGEIINADMGQLYEPFGIGTAKPTIAEQGGVPHWLYGVIDQPIDYSAPNYRDAVVAHVHAIHARGRIPIIVGGSGFYCLSLLSHTSQLSESLRRAVALRSEDQVNIIEDDWQTLERVDPVRAAAIHPNDTYRIQRALQLWQATGVAPSTYQPTYAPITNYIFVQITVDRAPLIERIAQRAKTMLAHGWIDECRQLMGTQWQTFIERKGFIGYTEIFAALARNEPIDAEQLATVITQKTAAYAKRQATFARMLHKKITSWGAQELAFNLTLSGIDLYLNQLVSLLQLKR